MAEGASIAEAAVQLTLDDSGFSAEVSNLQGKLEPAFAEAGKGMNLLTQYANSSAQSLQAVVEKAPGIEQVAASTEMVTTGSRLLASNLSRMSMMMETGNVSARGLASMLQSLNDVAGTLGNKLASAGMIIASAIGGWKIGSIIGEKLFPSEMTIETIAKVKAEAAGKAWNDAFGEALSTMQRPDVLGGSQVMDAGIEKERAARTAQMNIELAQASLAVQSEADLSAEESAAGIKKKYAEIDLASSRDIVAKKRSDNKAALAQIEREYTEHNARLEQKRQEHQIRDYSSMGAEKAEKKYAEELAILNDVDNKKKALDTVYAESKRRLAADDLQLSQSLIESESAAKVAAIELETEERRKAAEGWKETYVELYRTQEEAATNEKQAFQKQMREDMKAADKKAALEQATLSHGAASAWETAVTRKPKSESDEIQEKGNKTLEKMDAKLGDIKENLKKAQSGVFGEIGAV